MRPDTVRAATAEGTFPRERENRVKEGGGCFQSKNIRAALTGGELWSKRTEESMVCEEVDTQKRVTCPERPCSPEIAVSQCSPHPYFQPRIIHITHVEGNLFSEFNFSVVSWDENNLTEAI